MAPRHIPDDLGLAFMEMRDSPDRPAVIVGASLLEYALEEVLMSVMREPRTSNEREAILGDHGVLTTLSQKIWAAYFLRIIGPSARSDMYTIKNIRNIAAHSPNYMSFSHVNITDKCLSLKLKHQASTVETTDPREIFISVIMFFVANLIARARIGADLPIPDYSSFGASLDL